MPPRIIINIGQRFTRLTVTCFVGKNDRKELLYECRCDCGQDAVATARGLRDGFNKSCGCLQRSCHTTHGMKESREYRIWRGIKKRCLLNSDPAFSRYGGRGIRLHEPWIASFEAFYAHVGPQPSRSHTIERKDTNGHYEPGNVKWATMQEQQRNRRNNIYLTSGQETKLLVEWAESLNAPISVLYGRKRRGWTDEAILSTPL